MQAMSGKRARWMAPAVAALLLLPLSGPAQQGAHPLAAAAGRAAAATQGPDCMDPVVAPAVLPCCSAPGEEAPSVGPARTRHSELGPARAARLLPALQALSPQPETAPARDPDLVCARYLLFRNFRS